MANISFDPTKTTSIPNAFVAQTGGWMAGVALDDPALRYQLEGGVVGASQSTPLYGGLPVLLAAPTQGAQQGSSLGPTVTAATTTSAVNGWVVFNQASNGIVTSSGNAPTFSSGMSVNFIRSGSLLRLALPVGASSVNALAGAAPGVALYWDFTNNVLTTTNPGTQTALAVQFEQYDTNSQIVTLASGNYNFTSGNVAIVRV